LTANEYFYCPDKSYNCTDTYKESEFIHVDEHGGLTLDTTGLTTSNYSVVIGRYEYITQCQYDASQAIEHLIRNSAKLAVDVHRVGLSGQSAGGGEINYLAWVYHKLHPGRYTPVSMTYQMAQLNYPVGETLEEAWALWEGAVGEDMLVSKVVDKSVCDSWMGNPECSTFTAMDVCNATWQAEVLKAFCDDAFSSLTIGQLRRSPLTSWRTATTQQKGLEKLWYTSRNLAAANRTLPMYMHIVNWMNGTGAMDLPHSPVYAAAYAKYAKEAGGAVNYAVYYTDYTGIKDVDVSNQRFDTVDGYTYNYLSNFDLFNLPGMSNVSRTGSDEQFLLHCHAFGINCSKV